MISRPLLIDPFESESKSSSITRFSTNLNTVEIVCLFSVDTTDIYLAYPDGTRERITNSIEYFYKDELGEPIPSEYGSGENGHVFPFESPIYGKIAVDLVPNHVNSVTIRVHDGNYNYDLQPSVPPNASIRTEEITLLITQAPSESMGVVVDPPTILYTDYKDAFIVLNFQDNNSIDEMPLGSGYKVYYTMEQRDRVGTYKALNTDLISEYLLENVNRSVLRTDIFSEKERLVLEQEATGSVFEYEYLTPPALKSDYYIRSVKDDYPVPISHTVDISGDTITKVGVFDTAPFERVGVRFKVGTQINTVREWVSGVSVSFDDVFLVNGVGISGDIVGQRAKDLHETSVRDYARDLLIGANSDLETFSGSITTNETTTIGVNTINIADTSIYESVGLTLVLKDSNNILLDQVTTVVSWITNVSVTVADVITGVYDTIELLYSINSESDCERYVIFLNQGMVSGLIVGNDLDNAIFDCNISVFKHKSVSPLYTYGAVSDVALRTIDICNIIVSNYPEFQSLYTYGFQKDVIGHEDFFKLKQSINIVLGEPEPYYFIYEKLFLDPVDLDSYDGLYLTQQSFHKTPVYHKVYYREIDVDVEATISTNEYDRLLKLNVDDSLLLGEDVLDPSLLIFFSVTFVYKDPARRVLVESAYSKETFGTILDVDVEDQRPNNITQRDFEIQLISEINAVEPDLDLKPGSVVRSVFINPLSSVMENLSFREYFREISQSFVALLEFDGLDDNGNSVAVIDSTQKVQLRNAFGLDDSLASDRLIQEYIDTRFDLLASNFGVERGVGRYARGEVIFSAPALPADTQTLILAKGSIVSTLSPELQFVVLTDIRRGNFSQVKNQQGYYTARAFVRSFSTGSRYVVPVDSITNVSGAFVGGMKVTNPSPTYGGQDLETNLQLVETVRRKLLSMDTGTINGYLQKIAFLGTVERAKVVSSGHPYMRRDYDFVLGRGGFNAVDVYIRGLFPRSYNQDVGIYFKDKEFLQSTFSTLPVTMPNGALYYKFNIGALNITLKDRFIDIYKVLRISVPLYDSLELIYSYSLENIIISNRFEFSLPYAGNEAFIDALLSEVDPIEVFVECSFRRDYDIPFDLKPALAVNSAVDSFGNNLSPDLNYITYNRSKTLIDRGSLIEDSGISVIVSPLQDSVVTSFTDESSVDGITLEIPDGYFSPVPYIQDPDNLLIKYIHGIDFRIVERGRYFYIRVDAESASLDNNRLYNVHYGPYYSKIKEVKVVYDTDILVDLKIYSSTISVEYTTDTDELTGQEIPDILYSTIPNSFMTYRGNGTKLFVFLTDRNLIDFEDDLIEVTHRFNLNIGDPVRFNQPVFTDLDSDYNITLVSGIEHEMTKMGIDPDTIVVRPASDLEADLEPYIPFEDYRITQRGYKTFIEPVDSGTIVSSQAVNMEYYYSNELRFNISYDSQVEQVTEYLKDFSHAGSNFLVMNLRPVKIVVKAVVFVNNINQQPLIDSDIRNRIFRYVSQMGVGESLYESDVIGIIEQVTGVRNLRVKLAVLSLKEGEVSYLEKLDRNDFHLYETGYVNSYYTLPNFVNSLGEVVSNLRYVPLNNGGYPDKEREVLVDGHYYEIVESPDLVSFARGRAHISSTGSVYISFIDPDLENPKIEVTYQINRGIKARDIIVFPFQYIEIDTIDLIFEVE